MNDIMETQNYLIDPNDLSNVPEKDTSHQVQVCGDWVLDDITILSVTDLQDNKITPAITKSLQAENNILQHQCINVESKFTVLQKENERLEYQLSEEKGRAEKYYKKLQYIHDNHAIFDRLKEAYLNMKYNESVTRPMVEIKEIACQSETYLDCNSDVAVNTSTSNLYPIAAPGYVTVQKSDLDAVKETVATIKEFIHTRSDTSLVLGEQREAKYRKDIADLFRENLDLKQKVEDLEVEQEVLTKKFVSTRAHKENSMLKKIIAKLEQKIRCLETDLTSDESTTNLNDKEQKLVEIISTKYDEKQQQKLLKSEQKIALEGKISTPYLTARSVETPIECDSNNSFRSCHDAEVIHTENTKTHKKLEVIHMKKDI